MQQTRKYYWEENPKAIRDGYTHSHNFKVIRKADAWIWVKYNILKTQKLP